MIASVGPYRRIRKPPLSYRAQVATRLPVLFHTLTSTSSKMCQTVVARHNCLHRATHIKKCAVAIEKERGTRNRPSVWARMTSLLPVTQHRIEPPNPHFWHWDEERLTICPGCRKLGYNDSQGPMIQEREDAKRKHARNIQLGKFVGHHPKSSAPTAQPRVPPPVVQAPPRLAARPPHRSRFGLAHDKHVSAQHTRPGIARQKAVRGGSSSNSTNQAQSTDRCPPCHRRIESKDVKYLPIPAPSSIMSLELRRNRGESKALPPIPLRPLKQVFGRANSSSKRSIPRKPVASPKSKGQSPAPPPLRLATSGSSSGISSRTNPTMNQTSWQHSHGDTGRLRTSATAQTPQVSRVRGSIVNEFSPLTAGTCDARDGLYTATMDFYFLPSSSRRTAPRASHNARIDSLPRLVPAVYRPSTSPPSLLPPGLTGDVSATPSVDLDSVEEMFNRAASQAQARNQVRDWQRSDTSLRQTCNGKRNPIQSGGRRAGRRN